MGATITSVLVMSMSRLCGFSDGVFWRLLEGEGAQSNKVQCRLHDTKMSFEALLESGECINEEAGCLTMSIVQSGPVGGEWLP